MATENGTDIILFVDGERFAALTANELNISGATRDTTNKDSGGWKELEYGLKEGSFSGTGLFLHENKNLLTYSEALGNAAWVKTGLAVSSTPQMGINGLKTAFLITGISSGDSLLQNIPDIDMGTTIVLSVWLAGSGNIKLSIVESGGEEETTITLTSTLTRYTLSYTLMEGTSIQAGIEAGTATSVTMVNPQLEINSDGLATAYKPSGRLYNYFMNCIINNTKVDCVVTNQKDYKISGQALINTFGISAPMEDNATINADFTLSNLISTSTF
jgi:predicted secreted protein